MSQHSTSTASVPAHNAGSSDESSARSLILTTHDGRPAVDLFSVDPSVVHLNHASFGSPPRAATEAQARMREQMLASPVGWFPGVADRVAHAREQLAPFLRVEAEALAMVHNASAGASVVLASLEPTVEQGSRPEVLVTDHGYGAVSMGAERWARRVGGKVVTAHVPLGADADTARDAILSAVTDRTALLLLDQVTSATARRLPVGEVARAARALGIRTAVDAAHVPLHLPDGIAEADADYWFANLHKFACAPAGSAVVTARAEHRDSLYPLIDSWGAQLGYPQRFDHQGTLDATSWLAAPTALRSIEDDLGWDRVRSHVAALGDHGERVVADAMSAATGEDCRVDVGMPVPGLRLVALPRGIATSTDTANALRDTVLRALGIEIAITSFGGRGYVRLSVHAYNTPDDYAAFAERAVPFLVDLARTHPEGEPS